MRTLIENSMNVFGATLSRRAIHQGGRRAGSGRQRGGRRAVEGQCRATQADDEHDRCGSAQLMD